MVVQGEAVRGRGGKEGKRGGRTSLNTTAAALVSDPAGLSCYLAWDYTPRPVARRQPNLCPALLSPRLTSLKSETRNFPSDWERKAHPARAEMRQRRTNVASAGRPHLVGLDEAHKHGEED